MSATDDASLRPAPSASPLRRPAAALAVPAAALAGAALALSFGPALLPSTLPRDAAEVAWSGGAPLAAEWPRALRAGEAATPIAGGARLRVTAPDAAAASGLAFALGPERAHGFALDRARRADALRRFAAERRAGPWPPVAPAAACAALLRGHARAARALAGPALEAEPAPPDAAETAALEAIAAAAAAGDPAALDAALAASLDAEGARLAGAAHGATPADRRSAWTTRADRWAWHLEALAADLEADLDPAARHLAAELTPAAAMLALERAVLPAEAAPAGARLAPPPVRRLIGPDAALAGAGALAGMAAAVLGLGRPARRSRRRPATADPWAGRSGAWLQLVAGSRPRDVARAVIEIAARAAAGGARVLVVDAGAALHLHRPFGAGQRPGFQDCLRGAWPALGVVQRCGAPRVLLLSSGERRGRPAWIQLDRLLEDLRPHCDRLILALDRRPPREIGSVLAGRLMDGWWAEAGSRPSPGAERIADRLGIAFIPLVLPDTPPASRELMRQRIAELGAGAGPARDEIGSDPPAPSSAPMVDAASAPVVDAAPGPEPPAGAVSAPRFVLAHSDPAPVLDPDAQVRERLRFLAWMRRVKAERGGDAPPRRPDELVGSPD